jgi:hypothetical protein
MTTGIKHFLRLSVLLGTSFLVFLFITKGYAESPPAMPVEDVTREIVGELGTAPIVVELFSSQACVFCPKADRLFADILEQENVIGLACHVDYFDVEVGALSKPFCSERQSWYMEKLFAGPNYTPQIVINGALDVIGYKFDEVINVLKKAKHSEVARMDVIESDALGTYKVVLPLDKIEKPVGSTDNIGEDVFVTPPMKEGHKGFAVLLQNMETGRILAVGRVEKS